MSPQTRATLVRERSLLSILSPFPRIAAPADGHRDPVRRLKTVRRPPYPNGAQAIIPGSSLTPLPLSSRRPSVSFGGFGLRLAAGRWVAVHLKTLLFVLTAAAGQHSYMPVSHPGRFPHGLAAPMTTALVVPSGILPFSFLLCGLRKAMVIPGRGPLSPLTLSAAERSRSLLPFRIVERLCKDPDLYFVL